VEVVAGMTGEWSGEGEEQALLGLYRQDCIIDLSDRQNS